MNVSEDRANVIFLKSLYHNATSWTVSADEDSGETLYTLGTVDFKIQ